MARVATTVRRGQRESRRVNNRVIAAVLRRVEAANAAWPRPVVARLSREGRNPFLVLVSCLLSLRTQDATTDEASARLFALARTPAGIASLPVRRIERAIYPVGFYRTKARTLKAISRDLIRRFDGDVPDALEPLLTLPGVGRKTANLVLTDGFGKPGICVDTHVHRITNRWGYVSTRTPDKTEMALRAVLPRPHWIRLNERLVTFGQNLCKPTSPHCSDCPVDRWCPRIAVNRSR